MIRYWSAGEGETLVLAHGVAGNHASWYQQVPVLARAYRVVTFDHRGFGVSEDAEGLGRSGFVDDLRDVLDELEVERASLIGQSMGGGTVASFARRYPERVRALVLADSLFGLDLPEDLGARFDEARSAAAGLPQEERVLGPDFRRDHPEGVSLYLALSSFNRTNRHNLTGSFGEPFPLDALGESSFPTLFLVGEHDPLTPPALVRQAAEGVEGSFVVEVSGAGHSPYFERPTEFNDSVLSFLLAAGVRGAARRAPVSDSAGYTRADGV